MELFYGDCIDIMEEKLEPNSVDMVFSDLPYGTTQNKWDSVIDLSSLWRLYHKVVKDNGAIVLTAQPPFDKKLAISNISNFRYEWIWEKNKSTGHLNAKRMPLKSHENILVFYKKLPTYNPQMWESEKPMNAVKPRDNMPEPDEMRKNYNHLSKRLGNPGGSKIRYPRDVVHFPVVNNDNPIKIHPTQKPVELCEYFIRTYSNEGDVILDNCLGSGTTGVAAWKTGRNFIGIENTEYYYNKAKERIEKLDKELPVNLKREETEKSDILDVLFQ